jgi:hypothetical protein
MWENVGMVEMPLQSKIALIGIGFAVIVAIVTLAQRLGDWRSKVLARLLGVAAAILVVFWLYVVGLWLFNTDFKELFTFQGILKTAIGILLAAALVWSLRFQRKVIAQPTASTSGFHATTQHRLIRADPIIQQAPRFIVTYRNLPGAWERLSFFNDGIKAAINVRPGPLVHEEYKIRSTHDITMSPPAIPSIFPGASGEGKIFADVTPGSGGKLLGIIRKSPPESVDSVMITFEDGERHKFEQRFELTRQTDDSIRWDPGPVTLQSEGSAQRA